jgi:hypothetical protein
MFDGGAPTSKLVLEKLKEPLVLERLRLIARRRARASLSADDLLDTAIARALDPDDSPWDPSRGPFETHMSYVMRQSLDRIFRQASAKREVPGGGSYDLPEVDSLEPPPDEELQRRETLAFWRSTMNQVKARLGDKHWLARQVVDLAARGIEEPAAQAKMLGCPVGDIYQARDTLKYHAKAVLEERERAERARMERLRAATRGKTEAIS